MKPENLDMDSIMEARRASVESSIRVIEPAEYKKMGEQLFPYMDHPWRHAFFGFIEENPGCTIHHAVTHEGINILYCRDKDKGMWFNPAGGCGPMQARGLAIMKEIVALR